MPEKLIGNAEKINVYHIINAQKKIGPLVEKFVGEYGFSTEFVASLAYILGTISWTEQWSDPQ